MQVNDFNLGRYWPVEGPQQTLFVPGPKIAATAGAAAPTFTVFELHNASSDVVVQLVGEPQLQVRRSASCGFHLQLRGPQRPSGRRPSGSATDGRRAW